MTPSSRGTPPDSAIAGSSASSLVNELVSRSTAWARAVGSATPQAWWIVIPLPDELRCFFPSKGRRFARFHFGPSSLIRQNPPAGPWQPTEPARLGEGDDRGQRGDRRFTLLPFIEAVPKGAAELVLERFHQQGQDISPGAEIFQPGEQTFLDRGSSDVAENATRKPNGSRAVGDCPTSSPQRRSARRSRADP